MAKKVDKKDQKIKDKAKKAAAAKAEAEEDEAEEDDEEEDDLDVDDLDLEEDDDEDDEDEDDEDEDDEDEEPEPPKKGKGKAPVKETKKPAKEEKKGKAAITPKGEKPPMLQDIPEGHLSTSDVAEMIGIEARKLRAVLRKDFYPGNESKRYHWAPDSKELNEILEHFGVAPKKKAKEASSKKKGK